MTLPLPGYGKALWEKRWLGARPRVVSLLVGDDWRSPKWMPVEIPRLAVKNAAWHERGSPRFDWRVVAACTVFAFDRRMPGDRASGPDGWDSWLWLLAEVRRFARDVYMQTPTLDCDPDPMAAEREVEVYAWLNRHADSEAGGWGWPAWWPHGDAFAPRLQELAA